MKLITDITDYYDSAIPAFQSAEYTWKRKREVFTEPMNKENDLLVFPSWYKHHYNFKLPNNQYYCTSDLIKDEDDVSSSKVYMIGVCGKWYYASVKTFEKTNNSILSYSLACDDTKLVDGEKKICTPYWEQLVLNNSDPNGLPTKVDKSGKFPIEWIKWEDTDANKKEFWYERTGINPMTSKWWTEDIFQKYGPILYVQCVSSRSQYIKNQNYKNEKDYYIIQSNPDLKALRFVKVMDPYTIMFKLDQWLNNQAVPDEAIVPVGDDITRLQAYGFDKKTSFRKGKEK